jgi:sugar/nucleoside kinase (ribokinase family)
VKRIRVAVVGGFTVDEIVEGSKVEERLGGSALYTSLGIYRAGGTPEVFSVIGKDFKFKVPEFIVGRKIEVREYSIRFRIVIQGNTRQLVLVKKVSPIRVNAEDLNDYDGVVINPVCKEVCPNLDVNKRIALDVQGLIRDCVENRPVTLTRTSLSPNKNFHVFHANDEELDSSGLSIDDLYSLGFNEVIISHGSKGFTLYFQRREKEFVPSVQGTVNVGNGDFLLGYYFTKRLMGLDPISASENALRASEDFSIYGLALLSLPR